MKRYGLIGEKLSHSFSKPIHEQLTGEPYELWPLGREELPAFLERREFDAINVTIPYKQDVIPYCAEVDERARRIGAVNTVVNDGGILRGYNTDYDGFARVLDENGIRVEGRQALILGSGGTSKTVRTVLADRGAAGISLVSRRPEAGELSYEEALRRTDTELIVNTTPVGMYPHTQEQPIGLSGFPQLAAVVDVIYNPLRTLLLQEARERSLLCANGLLMLVAQAKAAAELFRGRGLPKDRTAEVWQGLCRAKRNIVLTGMPMSGKSTVGRRLSERLGMAYVDTDEEIVGRAGMPVPEIFERFGEAGFRERERETVRELSQQNGLVISSGGGTILDPGNIRNLRLNGTILFLDRPLSLLTVGNGRPLAKSAEEIAALYEARYDLYRTRCDVRIENDADVGTALERACEAVQKLL